MEHDANVTPWELLARDLNLEIKRLPFNPETFEFELSDLEDLITNRTRLLCLNHASNMTGTINDVKAATKIAHNKGVLVYVDSVQYAPHGPIDVQDLDCDFLMCSPYKFFGPHMGVLWAREDILSDLKPYKLRATTNEAPDCFELGTLSHEAMAGVTAAVDYFAWVGSELAGNTYRDNWSKFSGRRQYVHAAMDYLFDYEVVLTKRFIEGLLEIPGITVQGITADDAMERRVPTISFTVDGMDPEQMAIGLAAENIFAWHGHNYAIEPAKLLGIYDKGSVVRFGIAHYNTISEVDLALKFIRKLSQ
jgi:cysteine desulfurase family protein (TIGR01976 family)